MSPLDGGRYHAILFDLDGTLIDTAPDMVAALQALQAEHGLEPVDYALGRSHVSNGAVGLVRFAFPDANDIDTENLRVAFIELYATRVCESSCVFDGLGELLDALDAGEIAWGVVTNKPHALTTPLLQELGLAARAACIISGDTLPLRKPDPAPLLHACELMGVAPQRTLYVGDAARDIEAGRAAQMATIAATYGYITVDDNPASWGADCLAADTEELAQIIGKAVNLEA